MKLAALLVLTLTSSVSAAGTKALIYCGPGDCIDPPMQLETALTGAGAEVDHETVLPDLAAYRIVFVVDPMAGIAADEAALQAFHAAGGTLVLVGECAQWNGMANATINELLAKLGSSLQIVTAAKEPDASCTQYTAQPSASPVMAGVASLRFAWTSTVTASPAQVLATYNGDVIAAGDASARLYVIGDSNAVLDGCSFAGTGNEKFFANLWAASAPGSGSGSGAGSDAGSDAGSNAAGGGSSGCQTGGGDLGGFALVSAFGLMLQVLPRRRRRTNR
jgi:hypothetical protein